MLSASSNQITEIEQFLTDRQLYAGDFDRLWSMLEAHRIDERERGDGTRIGAEHATRIMAWLRRNHGDGARPAAGSAASPPPGHRHFADRNGNCEVCGAEMSDPSLARA